MSSDLFSVIKKGIYSIRAAAGWGGFAKTTRIPELQLF
jgi:hypothetical protein